MEQYTITPLHGNYLRVNKMALSRQLGQKTRPTRNEFVFNDIETKNSVAVITNPWDEADKYVSGSADWYSSSGKEYNAKEALEYSEGTIKLKDGETIKESTLDLRIGENKRQVDQNVQLLMTKDDEATTGEYIAAGVVEMVFDPVTALLAIGTAVVPLVAGPLLAAKTGSKVSKLINIAKNAKIIQKAKKMSDLKKLAAVNVGANVVYSGFIDAPAAVTYGEEYTLKDAALNIGIGSAVGVGIGLGVNKVVKGFRRRKELKASNKKPKEGENKVEFNPRNKSAILHGRIEDLGDILQNSFKKSDEFDATKHNLIAKADPNLRYALDDDFRAEVNNGFLSVATKRKGDTDGVFEADLDSAVDGHIRHNELKGFVDEDTLNLDDLTPLELKRFDKMLNTIHSRDTPELLDEIEYAIKNQPYYKVNKAEGNIDFGAQAEKIRKEPPHKIPEQAKDIGDNIKKNTEVKDKPLAGKEPEIKELTELEKGKQVINEKFEAATYANNESIRIKNIALTKCRGV